MNARTMSSRGRPGRRAAFALTIVLGAILGAAAMPAICPAAGVVLPSERPLDPADIERARIEAETAPALAPGWENPDRPEEPPAGDRGDGLRGNGDNDPCHYPRGNTLVVHIFVSHTGGTWTWGEMDDAAARATVAQDWYKSTGPWNAFIHHDHDEFPGYAFYSATLNYAIPHDGFTYGMINEILTELGFHDADGDGAIVDEFTDMLQNWNGGWDNVITVWEPKQSGRSWAAFGLAYAVLYFNAPAGVFAHEMGHVYGACDEYVENGHCGGGIDCGNCGTAYLQSPVANGNCDLEQCPLHVRCVMKGNDLVTCPYTWDNFAWRNGDNDGFLDETRRMLPGGGWVLIWEIPEWGYFSWNNVTDGFAIAQQTRNWAAVGVRSPATSDYDIQLFGDNGHNFPYASSALVAGQVDFIVGDYNHAPLGIEHIQLTRYSGPADTYQLDHDGVADRIYPDGVARSGSLQALQFLKVYDVPLFTGEVVRFTAEVQTPTLDLGMALYRSNGQPYWTGRTAAVGYSDMNGMGGAEEFVYTVPADDVYGLVFFANTQVDGNFTIRVGGWPYTLAEETPVTVGGDLQLYNYDPNAAYWSFAGCQPQPGTGVRMALSDDENYQIALDQAADAGVGAMEFFAVDYNHANTGRDYLRVVRDSGVAGNHTIEWEHDPEVLQGTMDGWWSQYHLGKVWDAMLQGGRRYLLRQYHDFSTPLDTGVYMFSSSEGDSYKSKAEALASSDFRPASDGGEWMLVDAAQTDWHGVYTIVNNYASAQGSYSLWLGPRVSMQEGVAGSEAELVLWGDAPVASNYWTVFAARPQPQGGTSVWLYGDPAYTITTYCASDQVARPVSYVVADCNHATLGTYYPRFLRTGGSSFAHQFEAGSEAFGWTPGGVSTHDLAWPSGAVASMWDVWVDGAHPGGRSVRIEASDLSGVLDLGIAFFASNGAAYFADPTGAVASSDATGTGGTESFTVDLNRDDWYGVLVYNKSTAGGNYRIRVIDASVISVESDRDVIALGLRPLTANPFGDRIVLEASVPTAGDAAIDIYDAQGRLVRTLVDPFLGPARRTNVAWNGSDDAGRPVPGGVYFAVLRSGGQESRVRLIRSP